MKKTFSRALAALLCGALTLSMAACGSRKPAETPEAPETPTAETPADPGETVLVIDGHEVGSREYAAHFEFSKASIAAMMSGYGIENLWETELGEGYKEQLPVYTRDELAALYVTEPQFIGAGLTLTAEEETSCKPENTYIADACRAWGFTDEMIEQLARAFLMRDKLNDYYFGENGVMTPDETEVMDYYEANYLRAKHVLVSTMDEDRNPIEDEETLAALRARADEVYRRAAAGEDFDALIAEYGEDPGMESNPDGYTFTEGRMVAPFYEGTLALQPGEISEPVQSDYGWHIIERLPLLDEELNGLRSTIVTEITGMTFDTLVDQWVSEIEIEERPLYSTIGYDNVGDYLK